MSKDSFVYEDAIKELEGIVNSLNSGNVSLDDSLKLYSRGVELVALCDKKIKEVERKISLLNTENNEEEPFEASQE